MPLLSLTTMRRLGASLGLVLFTASCGSDATTQTASSSAATVETLASAAPAATAAPETTDAAAPIAVTAANGEVVLAATPTKIVSLSPTQTEILFAIGAGSQVIAVDDQSNFPKEAEAVKTDLSGFTPNVEAIVSYAPDLVVIADDAEGLVEQLTSLKIPVWSGPAATSLDDVYAQIEQLGVLTGHTAEAVQLTASMTADIETIVAGLPKLDKPLTYYHELDPTYFSSTSNTFIGAVYAMAGLVNIADTAEGAGDYPQLSAEFIVSANPDIMFLADTKCCGESPETVAARDGWSELNAVKNSQVIAMDDDIASRWGPRIVDYLRAVGDAVTAAAAVTAG